LKGDPGITSGNFRLQIFKNSIMQIDVTFTLATPGGTQVWATFLPAVIPTVTVALNDVLTAKIVPNGGGDRRPYLREVVIALCHGGPVLAYDTVLAAGTYVAPKAL
jgi:hypothetical protein